MAREDCREGGARHRSLGAQKGVDAGVQKKINGPEAKTIVTKNLSKKKTLYPDGFTAKVQQTLKGENNTNITQNF